MRALLLLSAGFMALGTPASAIQDRTETDETPEWDVASPPMETREVSIDVEEGTWINVDVSPDGGTIAFDLLGDIYTMPIEGGEPTRIAEGLPFEMQPQFSPDGLSIAFTSDRGGGDNLWVMNIDGSNKRPVTDEKFRLLNAPAWSPDGQYIAGRKHFTTARSLGTGEVWLYHVGGGDGIALVERRSEDLQKELGEPVFAPGGAALYYTRNTSSGNRFEYAQDSNREIFAIERIDLETGEVDKVVGGPGGAVRPTPSPDGEKLAFIKRERGISRLYVLDLASGATTKVYDDLDQDLQETWAVHGLYPTMEWMPNSEEIVLWAEGKIRRVSLDGSATDIPFRVTDTRDVVEAPRPRVEVAPDEFETTMPRFAVVSPNGEQVVFETLGKLYVMPSDGGTPKRLTRSSRGAREMYPSWSRDGRRIAFVEWNDDTLGTIKVVGPSGGNARALTQQPGHYRNPAFSPDGSTIVFERGSGGYLVSDLWSNDTGIFRMPATGGAEERILESGSSPQFAIDEERVFLTRRQDDKTQLFSVNLSGGEERVHAEGEMITQYTVSPDGRHVAFRDNYALHVAPLMRGPLAVGAGRDMSALPMTKVSDGGATYPSWSGDGERLHWTLGPTLFTGEAGEMVPGSVPLADEEEDEDSAYEAPTEGVSLAMTIEADIPDGRVALTGARIVTMAGDDGGIIEDGVIVIEGNRIAAVGTADEIDIPSSAERVDMAGKTIIPGLIDAHAHPSFSQGPLIPEQNWNLTAHLALGVTTVFDPSSDDDSFAAAHLQRTGDLLSPRIYTTGEIVYGAKSAYRFADVQTYDDALDHVERLKIQGAHGIKNYNQPRRDQRQQVVKAAKEQNILVVAEGGSLFTMDITLIADGNSALEHNIPQRQLYEDVLSFYAQTNVAYTPTLAVTYGGLAGDPYWRYQTDVWDHPILSQHAPPQILEPSSVRRVKAPEEDFADQYAAREARKLADRGVMVSIGAHGQQEGLAAHWEMWSFARGGMSPLEALRTATVTPARHLGFADDLGTLEEGKLADLVVLDDDPTTDIRNSDSLSHVMLNGRLYDARTLEEVATGNSTPTPYWWEQKE